MIKEEEVEGRNKNKIAEKKGRDKSKDKRRKKEGGWIIWKTKNVERRKDRIWWKDIIRTKMGHMPDG